MAIYDCVREVFHYPKYFFGSYAALVPGTVVVTIQKYRKDEEGGEFIGDVL